ncbi:hypothetical protein Unana1_00394 [Umbelopsis nana]
MVPLADGVSFLVNGGLSVPFNQSEVNQTTVFNTATKTWTSINSTGITQARQHQAVIDGNGRIWFWGGVSDYQTGYNNQSYWGAFTTLDTASWLWSSTSGNAGNADARVGHTMTITKDGLIHIIGGLTATMETTLDAQGRLQWLLSASSMSDVPVYNTYNGQWDLKTATGQIPTSRNIHSATLAADGNTIIVFGGAAAANLSAVYGDLYVFDASKSVWTFVNINGGPSPRAGHSAVQVNTTMFIIFGYDFTLTSLSDIHALDTINWRWVTQFSASGYPLQSNNSTLSPASNSTSSSSSSSSLSTGAIAGIAVGGGVAVIGAIGLFFFLRRRNKSQQRPAYQQAATGTFGQQPPPMQDNSFVKPLPPQHQFANQPEESLFNNGNQSESKGSYYGQYSSQQPQSSVNGSQGLGSVAGSDPTDATPPYSAPYSAGSQPPHTYGTTFTSKPDAAEVPHFTLQPSKPDEHD